MTHSFGGSLISTCLIPFADFLNHSYTNCTSYYMINSNYELNDEHKSYKVRKNRINLEILNELKVTSTNKIE